MAGVIQQWQVLVSSGQQMLANISAGFPLFLLLYLLLGMFTLQDLGGPLAVT